VLAIPILPLAIGGATLAGALGYALVYGSTRLIRYIASFFVFPATPRGVVAFATQEKRSPQDVMKEVMQKLPGFGSTTFNVGFIGSSGSGKSTLVGALVKQRLLSSSVAECTRAASRHPHPDIQNVSLWDLPGTGTVRARGRCSLACLSVPSLLPLPPPKTPHFPRALLRRLTNPCRIFMRQSASMRWTSW
jgi:hypothetical protein